MKPFPSSSRRQRGISLIVVMVMLLLSSLLVLSSSRTNWYNEALLSNESDYRRAYAAAEALIADAETDIRGILPGGVPCNTGRPSSEQFQGCRWKGNNRIFFPETDAELDEPAILNVVAAAVPCREGICFPATETALGNNWWNANLAAMTANTRTVNAVAATYGEHTLANPANTGNPLLGINNGQYNAWYWVEVMRYNHTTMASLNLPIPAIEFPFVYRITAFVRGNKPGTQVVLRSVFVPSEWLEGN
jgi:type IV pilus assembly protein PilX